jgi:autotransporter-associated beta strand protein
MFAATRPNRILSSRLALALTAAALLAPSARGQTWTNFTGVGGTNWTNAANWSALPLFDNTTVLTFPSTPPFGAPFQPLGTYTSTVDQGTGATVNQMIFNNFASPDVAAFGVTITSNAAGATILFDGANPAITQNGTGAVTFANGTATTDITLNANGLTINGNGLGHLTMAGVIGGTGNLNINQLGAGPGNSGALVTLSGANTFVGNTTLTAGNLVLGSATALGPAGTNSLIINGGTVRTTAVITVANPVVLNSQLFLTGQTNGITFTGPISGNGGITLKPTAGAPAYNFQNTISGNGAFVLDSFAGGLSQSTLSSQAAAGPHGTYLNASSYTMINSLLTVSNTTANVQRLNASAPMTMHSGLFQITGNASAPTSETLASLTMSGFGIFLGVSPNAAQPLSLTYGSLTRQNNATFAMTTTVAGTTLGGTPGTAGNANVLFTTSLAGDNINGVLPYGSAVVLNAGAISGNLVRYDNTTGVTPLNFNTDYDLRVPYLVGNSPTTNYRIQSTNNTFGGTGSIAVNSLLLETPAAAAALFGGALYGSGTISLTSGVLGMSLAGTQANVPTVVGSLIQQNIALGSATGYFHMTTTGIRNGNVLLGNITGTGGLVKSGPGNVVLLGDNSGLTGGLFVHAGGVLFSADNQLGAANAPIVLDGGVTANVNQALLFLPNNQFAPATASSLTVSRPITIGPAGAGLGAGGFLNSVSQTPGVTLTLDQPIGGTGRIFKLGTGVLRLTGNNTFSGGISLFQGGTTAVNSDAALGALSGDVFLGASIFQADASFSSARNFILTGANTIFTAGNNLSLSSPVAAITTATTLTKAGLGTLTLTAPASFAGGLTVGDTTATRRTAFPFAQPGGEVVLSGANGAAAMANAYIFNQGTRTTLDNSGVAGNINNNRLSSSQVTMNGGELFLAGNANGNVIEHVGRGAAGTGLIANSLGNTITVDQPMSAGGQNANLIFTSYNNPALTAATVTFFRGTNLGGQSGDFGNIQFVAAPTLTGTTGPIMATGLYGGSSTATPTDFATIDGSNRVIALPAASYTPLPTTGGASTTTHIQTGAGAILTGPVASNALKIADSSIDLAGSALSITGTGQLLSTGAANVDAIRNTGNPAGLVFTGASAKITTAQSLDIGTAAAPVNITTASGLLKFGPGELRISDATGVTGGGITIAQGSLRLLTATALPAGQNLTMAPGTTLELNNFGTPAAPVTTNALVGFGTVNIGTGALQTGTTTGAFGGNLVGTGTFIKNGAGTQTLNGNSPTFSGDVRIVNGVVIVDTNVVPSAPSPGALGSGTTPIQLGDTTGANVATLQFSTNVTRFERNIVVPAGGTATNVIRATDGIVATVTSDIQLQNRTLQFSLGTNVNATIGSGSVTFTGVISGSGPGTAGSFALIHEGGYLNLWGNNTFTGDIRIFNGNRVFLGIGSDSAFGQPTNAIVSDSTFSGGFRADNGARTIPNPMTFTTTGAILTYTGVNDMNWTGTMTIGTAARTFDVISAGITTFSGNVIGTTGSIIKNGGGTMVLSGNSTYTGGTTVNAGTLLVNNTAGSGTGTGTVTVTGATLGGTGSIAGAVTINANGRLKPGASPGVLTVNNAVTMATGSIFAGDIQGITPGNGTNNHAQLIVTGGLTLNSPTLNLSFAGYTPTATDQIEFIRYTGGALTGTFNGLPDGSIAYSNVLGSGVDYRIWYGSIPAFGSSIVLSPVPEPLHILLMCGGVTVGVRWWRRRTKAAVS